MNKLFVSCFLFTLLLSSGVCAQDVEPNQNAVPSIASNKGKIYVFWGWNRGWYTNSDIHFQGDDYDFILDDVKATDRQTEFSFGTYFNPSTITIPQTNFRLGYFINNNVDISFGVDHMKYVMVEVQETKITGKIENETDFVGVYDHDDFLINKSFMSYEHTDGLNYINFEITYNKDVLDYLKIKSNPDKFKLDVLVGFGVGGMLPKSNVTLMNKARHDDFHVSGYGINGKTGINITLFKHILFRTEYKGGFIHMTDIRTTQDPSDRARQYFFFRQLNFLFGFCINPF